MKKKILLTTLVLTILFIPKIVNAEDKIHFVSLRDGDGIIIETNVKVNNTTVKHCGLVDAGYPETDLINGNAYQATGNGTIVKNYAQKIGCNYFDFVIMTHNHSDHIGGIPLLKDFFKSNTLAFYKEDEMADGDVEEAKGDGNNSYYATAMKALNGTQKCEVRSAYRYTNNSGVITNLNNSFIGNIKYTDNESFKKWENGYDTNVRRNIYFKFGNFNIKIYALHTLSKHNENLNSLVTLVEYTAGTNEIKGTAVLTGDIAAGPVDEENPGYIKDNIGDLIINPTGKCSKCKELGPENQVADAIMYELGLQNITKVDVLKSAHHGNRYSNSIYSLDKYNPKYYISTRGETYTPDKDDKDPNDDNDINGQNANLATMTYLTTKHQTKCYHVAQGFGKQISNDKWDLEEKGAVVVEFNDESTDVVSIKSYSADIQNICKADESGCRLKKWTKDDSSWPKGWKEAYIYNYSTPAWAYVDKTNGKLIINKWIKLNDQWYHLNEYGITDTDWTQIKGEWYYFNKYAQMVTVLQQLEYNGKEDYYYFITGNNSNSGQMRTGWTKTGGYWYYFRTKENEISTGPKGAAVTGLRTIGGNKYYFNKYAQMVTGLKTIGGNKYYFRKENDPYSPGIEGSAVKNATITINGTKYKFDSNGVGTIIK